MNQVKAPAKITVHVDLPTVLKVCCSLLAQCLHFPIMFDVVHLTIFAAIQEVSLTGLGGGLMPRSKEVDTLASEIRRLKEKGIAAPFVYMPVSKFSPTWAEELEAANDDEESDHEGSAKALQEIARALGKDPNKKVCLQCASFLCPVVCIGAEIFHSPNGASAFSRGIPPCTGSPWHLQR